MSNFEALKRQALEALLDELETSAPFKDRKQTYYIFDEFTKICDVSLLRNVFPCLSVILHGNIPKDSDVFIKKFHEYILSNPYERIKTEILSSSDYEAEVLAAVIDYFVSDNKDLFL